MSIGKVYPCRLFRELDAFKRRIRTLQKWFCRGLIRDTWSSSALILEPNVGKAFLQCIRLQWAIRIDTVPISKRIRIVHPSLTAAITRLRQPFGVIQHSLLPPMFLACVPWSHQCQLHNHLEGKICLGDMNHQSLLHQQSIWHPEYPPILFQCLSKLIPHLPHLHFPDLHLFQAMNNNNNNNHYHHYHHQRNNNNTLLHHHSNNTNLSETPVQMHHQVEEQELLVPVSYNLYQMHDHGLLYTSILGDTCRRKKIKYA